MDPGSICFSRGKRPRLGSSWWHPWTVSHPTGQGSRLAGRPSSGAHKAWASCRVLCGVYIQAHAAVSRTEGPCPCHRQQPTQAYSGFKCLTPLSLQWRKFSAFVDLMRTLGPWGVQGHPHLRGLKGPGLWDHHRAPAELMSCVARGWTGGQQGWPCLPHTNRFRGTEAPSKPFSGELPQGLRGVRWGGRGSWGSTASTVQECGPGRPNGLVLQEKWQI